MLLTAGMCLGPYEILSAIGAGGMGEIYRARDPRLKRDVAIKVLPGPLAADESAVARFEREAKVLAALSHANLLAIHDVGVQDRTVYAVMELSKAARFQSERNGGGIFVMGATGESVRRVTDFGFAPSWSADGSELVVSTSNFRRSLQSQPAREAVHRAARDRRAAAHRRWRRGAAGVVTERSSCSLLGRCGRWRARHLDGAGRRIPRRGPESA